MAIFEGEALIQVLEQWRIFVVVYMVCTAAWLADYVHLLEEEVSLVWFSKWTGVKYVYLSARLTMAAIMVMNIWALINPTATAFQCRASFIATSLLGFINGVLCEGLVYIHVHAFCHTNPKIGFYLLFQWTALLCVACVTTILLSINTNVDAFGIYGLNCIVLDPAVELIAAQSFSVMAGQFILVAITMWAIASNYRGLKKRGTLVAAFIRDGLIFPYGVILATALTVLVAYRAKDPALKILLSFPRVTFANIMTARLVLHLRKALHKTEAPASQQLSTIRFKTGTVTDDHEHGQPEVGTRSVVL